MARPPAWYQGLDRVLDQLQTETFAWVDRPWVEQHLGLSRRDAIRFLHRFGAREGDESDGTRLRVSRTGLVTQLAAVRDSPDYLAEQRRRAQVARQGVALRREAAAREVLFPAPPPEPAEEPPALPPTLRLTRTAAGVRLTVDATDPLDLLRQNYLLGLQAEHDLEGYFRFVENAPRDTEPR